MGAGFPGLHTDFLVERVMMNIQYMRKFAGGALILCAGLCVNMAQAQTVTLVTLQSVYTNKVMRIEAETQVKKGLAVQEYGADLQAALITIQKAGDFDGYILLEKEIARYKIQKTVPASSEIPQLATILATYQKKLATCSTELAEKKIEMGKQYQGTLIALRKELMVQNKMKEAGEVNDVVKQVESDIKEIGSGPVNSGDEDVTPDKPETKLDELFGEEPVVVKPKPVNPEKTKLLATPSSEGKKKSKKGPPEAVEYNGHFYQYFAEKLKWDIAKSKCQTRGGHLVSIGDKAENKFVSSLIEGEDAVWIGFYKSVDSWKWVNLEKIDYLNWRAGKPNITKKSSYMGVNVCAFISGTERVHPSTYSNGIYRPSHQEASGEWEDSYSDASVDGYICEWDE